MIITFNVCKVSVPKQNLSSLINVFVLQQCFLFLFERSKLDIKSIAFDYFVTHVNKDLSFISVSFSLGSFIFFVLCEESYLKHWGRQGGTDILVPSKSLLRVWLPLAHSRVVVMKREQVFFTRAKWELKGKMPCSRCYQKVSRPRGL